MMSCMTDLPRSRRLDRIALLMAAAVFIGVFLVPLGLRPLVMPDEGRYGVIPAEMIETGEWIVPHLLGVRYFEKPVLGYWMTAAAFLGFGENAFALRLPSALTTGFAAGLVLLFVRRWTSRWDVAAIAAMVFMTSLEVAILGTTAVLDGPFAALVTGSITFFFLAWRATGPVRFGWLVASGAACGLAFLTKGFLAIAIPGIVLAPWLAWERDWKGLLTLPWVPGIVAIATVLPWGIAVHLAAPEYWHYFFWIEHINRFTGGARAQHPEPWWYFIPILILGLFPWCLTLPFVFGGLRRIGGSPETRLLLCWTLIPVVFFSISSGKLATYILPAFAPAAILITTGLLAFFRNAVGKRTRGEWLLIPLGAVLLLITPFMPLDPSIGSAWEDGGEWRLAILATALLAWGIFDRISQSTLDPRERILLGCLGPALVFSVAPACLPTGWMKISKAPVAWLDRMEPLTTGSLVLAEAPTIHGAGWAWPDAEIRLLGSPGELTWGVENFREHAEWHVEDSELTDVLRTATLDRPVVLLADDPETRSASLEAISDAAGLGRPAFRLDRDILIAVWPAAAVD
ncbi:MAG: hypothetical protein CMJ52_00285 [Planctomycetaceae bacterium]|nr:hypothetical protein [Planctomycetaceae bacterium]